MNDPNYGTFKMMSGLYFDYFKLMIRAVILLGGPSKKASYGAYEEASPLFPIAGLEIIAHTMFAM